MRALVLSDIHGNIDALQAVDALVLTRERVDEVWVLGDLVDYGPAPADVVDWVRRHATRVVRGNHDHAMGTGDDCRSAPAYHPLSVATRELFRPQLPVETLAYLAGLPLLDHPPHRLGDDVVLVHASPRDPLFGYIPTDADDDVWRGAIAPAGHPAFLLVGHTHDQFTRRVGRTQVVNPGSVGLPKDGDPRAAFAVFADGRIDLRRVPYDTERAAARIEALALGRDDRRRLQHLLRHATLP